MKELAEYLLKALVEKPEAVAVSASEENGVMRLKASVADSDKGKVIGKDGKVIKAVRAVIAAGAAKTGKKVFLDLE
ncbi:MAG: KH domain-containing protein [Elusimicrobiaceae bacterium]